MLLAIHTSDAHVPVFDSLLAQEAPGVELRHLVRPGLLDRARDQGPEAVAADLAELLALARDQGAGAVLCTCSTIGSVAEEAAAHGGTPVTLRVDRPMAAAAVAAGPRVAVVATQSSTVGPTSALIRQEAARAGREVRVRTHVHEEAWPLFARGEQEGYLDAVAAVVREVDASGEADAIVLAQASTAPVADRVQAAVPVLASPRTGLRAAVAALGGAAHRA
ncbi:aspartate/glutamate racemase family protein [Streptomyces sp. NPDC059740]|uniref:aspartate/glutamate racemase family protein n=1 Tax=Streptomyces sp. NPDC059740 TaxID=3346926 RepID=UPI003646433D